MLTDEQLSLAFANRTDDALAEAYRRYFAVLSAVGRSILGSTDEAQDCVHDVVLRIWLSPDMYRRARGTLRAFLIVSVRNAALSRRRAAARHFALEQREARLGGGDPDVSEPVDEIEVARLQAALHVLPPGQRAVVELAYFQARTQTEIAAELGLPLGTVKSRAAHALRKLATLLGPPRNEG